ncbi:APC family permease [Fodinicola acaciae]|uniref:APC family permease n=1 Tax=Fodinicola acaciae TaxID=2681555 RepID=UPI0013D7E57A|nr:APC family permease [Fodinicola acaciae]
MTTTTTQVGLRRSLKALGTLLITLSAITPASSVFIIAPGVIGQAGTGAFWSFVVAGLVGVLMAFVYAELSSAYPLTGGEYAIVARTVGKLPGFMVMVLMLFTQVIIVAVIALGVGIYLGALIPGLNGPVVAAVTVLVTAVLGVFDVKLNAVVTGIFLAIEILALLLLSGLGFLHVERPITDLILHPVMAGPGLPAATLGVIGAATAVAIFAYNGYGSAVVLGEETRDAPRTIARAILWALVVTVAAELIPVTAVLLGAPDLHSLFGSQNMLDDFVRTRAGNAVAIAMSLAVALAIINAVLAILLLTARLFFSSARDGVWPASRTLQAIHPRFRTPWVATLIVGAVSAVVCFVDLHVLLVVTGTSLVAVYASLCVATLTGRRNGTTAHSAYRMPLFPLPPLIALAALVYVTYQNLLDPAVGRPSLIVTVGVLVLAAAYYLLFLRGKWELRGPAD